MKQRMECATSSTRLHHTLFVSFFVSQIVYSIPVLFQTLASYCEGPFVPNSILLFFLTTSLPFSFSPFPLSPFSFSLFSSSSACRMKERWIPYPFQNNICSLPLEDQVNCINGLIGTYCWTYTRMYFLQLELIGTTQPEGSANRAY